MVDVKNAAGDTVENVTQGVAKTVDENIQKQVNQLKDSIYNLLERNVPLDGYHIFSFTVCRIKSNYTI